MVSAINDELDKLKQAYFIELSISLYSAFIVCVRKSDNTLWVTIDYRIVNKNIISDTYLMHSIDDQLESMLGSKVFTMLDPTKGYHQMKLYEDSKDITAFSSPKGFFHKRSCLWI